MTERGRADPALASARSRVAPLRGSRAAADVLTTGATLNGRPIADIGAERAALGAAIQSAGHAAEVAAVVAAEDFYEPQHRVLFERLVAMRRRGAPIDPETVRFALEEAGEFVGTFQAPYLHTLMQECVVLAHAAEYARQVARVASRRRTMLELEGALRSVVAGDDLGQVAARVGTALDIEARLAGLEGPSGSWAPADLGPILRGEQTRPEPTVGLARSDGLRLLYPGKEHAVIGEMECGKSWFCAACCVAELTAGHRVLYVHFEEADPTDTVGRLLALGAPPADIAARFCFVGPDEPVQPGVLAALLDPAPTLVVLDGVNEAMALHGQGIAEAEGAAAFRRLLVKPCTAVGAAVLATDHVVKDREARGRTALGTVHKGNGLTGALILLDNTEPFGRGRRGRSHLYVTKDRPAHLRCNGRPTKIPGKTFMGELVVDDTRERVPYLDLTFWAPAAPGGQDQDPSATDPRAADDEHVLAVVRELLADGKTVTGRAVRAKCNLGTTKALDALERLVIDKRLTKTPGKGNSHLFTLPSDPDTTPPTTAPDQT